MTTLVPATITRTEAAIYEPTVKLLALITVLAITDGSRSGRGLGSLLQLFFSYPNADGCVGL